MGPRLGIVGAGRTRNGLGPFLAEHAERAGARIVAVCGRDPAGGVRQAADLAVRLGHPVQPLAGLEALDRDGLDGLVIASPPTSHLAALQAALDRGLPTLCEKPLVAREQIAAALPLVAGFAGRSVLLEENCQWPFVLPVFDRVAPGWRDRPVRSLAMGLSPSAAGTGMLADSLSHLLSVAQAVAPFSARTRLVAVARAAAGGEAAQIVDLQFAEPGLTARLELRVCAEQPRPAFVALDGVRVDRRIGPGYRIEFATAERSWSVPDPLATLVYRFVSLLPHPSLDRIQASADAITVRLRLYAEILARLEPDARG